MAHAWIETEQFDWEQDTFKAMLIDAGFDVNPDNHKTLVDIPQSVRVSLPVELKNTKIVNGSLNADNLCFEDVEGATIGSMLIYKAAGKQSDSVLVFVLNKGMGFPCQPNGGDIVVGYPNGKLKPSKTKPNTGEKPNG